MRGLSLVATLAHGRPPATNMHRHLFAIVIQLTRPDPHVNAVFIQLLLNIGRVLRDLLIALFIGSLRLKLSHGTSHSPAEAISAATFAGFSTISHTIREMLLRVGR